MRLQPRRKQLILKVVYYGPGMSGKTTNLKRLHAALPERSRGELIQLDTESERTLFFDYFPLQLGRLGDFNLRVHFFTVPGQSFYRKTRAAVLQGADSVVFVADSDPRREQANLRSLEDMEAQLSELGQAETPRVFQWNKRDLRRVLPVNTLGRALNPDGHPAFEAVAVRGDGVHATQSAAVRAAIQRARTQMATGG